jgi:hypothetical protein
MVETWVCPELGTNFTENFAVMAINHIFNNWSYTALTGELSGLNKPTVPSGQTNTIDFRAGIDDDFKTLEVTCLQGDTNAIEHHNIGQKRIEFTTEIMVTCKAFLIGRDDVKNFLKKMDDEIVRICGQYKQSAQTGQMVGIKDWIYQRGRRVYNISPMDMSDKSEWKTLHTILMWYELADVQ